MPEVEIRIDRARSHNLKGVSCRIPLRSLTVITGPSGSGKSSLAFDTLYAEGQRRYVGSLSTYARQFLERLPRPEVDAISHLPPAIAIEQRNRVTNARSTVGTQSEVLDLLRLLYSHAAELVCPDCGAVVVPGTVASVVEEVLARHEGGRVSIAAPPPPEAWKAGVAALRERLLREGYTRWLDAEARVVDAAELSARRFAKLRAEAGLLIDRLAVRPDARGRLAEAVGAGFERGEGEIWIVGEDGARGIYHRGHVCDGCGRPLREPVPALFSFNSPLGACPTCQGFGRVAGLDLERVVPDPEASLSEGAIAPFATPMGRGMQEDLLRACTERGVPSDRPWRGLDDQQRAWVIEGDEDEKDGVGWYGVRGFFHWLEGRRYKVQARVLIARYRRFDPCPDCGGTRLRPEARHARVADRELPALCRMTVSELVGWLATLELPAPAADRCERLLPILRSRVATLEEVGVGYLSLERPVRTLSGGEAQRLQLATALSGHLTATLYVLDEPSVGLHPLDVDRLLGVLRGIRERGNTVVVVEHAPEVVSAADHVIDMGPGAGRHGGEIVVEGDVASVRAHASSATGRALRGEIAAPAASAPRKRRASLRVVGARAQNLANIDVEIPLGRLVVFTGVSGAGKSTLVRSVLVGHLTRDPERGACTRVEGADQIVQVQVVDQSPPVRSPRSNPATVSKAFEGIRKLFAGTREARARGVGPGWFSFNVAGGRCDACEGTGELVVDMQFLDDVRVPCDACSGRRFRPEVLEIRLDGRSIVDVLDLSVEEALVCFRHERSVVTKLEPLARVGLGYLQLGQPLSTLSGGEHQRLRLSQALSEGGEGVLYVLDEPTTGLHPVDVEVLLHCLDALIANGGSVLVIEHNLDVIRRADHVIDLGPGGGPGGGRVVAVGTPEEVAATAGSQTGVALRRSLELAL